LTNPLKQTQTTETSRPSGSRLAASRPRIQLAELTYHLFDTRTARGPLFDRAYALWRDIWTATFRELKGVTRINSDEFMRQSEIGALVRGESCVSLTGMRWMDLSRPMAVDDSYFSIWPEKPLQRLAGAQICIGSQTVVAPEWRGSLLLPPASVPVEPMSLTQATISMSLRRFVESKSSLFVGVTRNDRGIDRVAQALNGDRIATIPVHGLDSDIVLWTQGDVTDLGPLIGELWDRRAGH